MIIYLYIKTHNITGLKYLGKTTRNPFKYKGSGKYWNLHLKKHGVDITTEILLETTDKNEIKSAGLYYSQLFNVVDSEEWANLKPECGDGGGMTPEIINKILATKKANGYVMSEETKIKISKTLTGHKRSTESIQKSINGNKNIKRSASFKENLSTSRLGVKNPFFGKTHTAETKLKISESHKGKTYNQPKYACEHCGLITIKTNLVRWHGNNCKQLKIARGDL